jgi:hypothetical protein
MAGFYTIRYDEEMFCCGTGFGGRDRWGRCSIRPDRGNFVADRASADHVDVMESTMLEWSRRKSVKRLAGIRIPKNYRWAANGLVRFSNRPFVREAAAAAGVVAAAGVLIRQGRVRATAGKLHEGVAEGASATPNLSRRLGHAIGMALAGAILNRRSGTGRKPWRPAASRTPKRWSGRAHKPSPTPQV